MQRSLSIIQNSVTFRNKTVLEITFARTESVTTSNIVTFQLKTVFYIKK